VILSDKKKVLERGVSMKKLVGLLLFLPILLNYFPALTGAQDYEKPPLMKASRVLPPELLKSAVHQVREDVTSEGYLYHFIVESQFGLYDIESLDLLRIRVHEIKTLANVIEKNQTHEFMNGLKNQLYQTMNAPVQIIQDPLGSISAMGQGVGKQFQRIGNLFKSREKSTQEDTGLRTVMVSAEKRKLAAELNLDVYSTNPKVQDFLNSVAEARARGTLAMKFATFAIPGGAGIAVSALSYSGNVEDLLRDNSPMDLYVLNEKKLREMGFDSYRTGRFLNHPDLSPRHKTVIVAALESMKGVSGREALLDAALNTEGKESLALFQENRAVLLSKYHARFSRLKQIQMQNGIPTAVTESGKNLVLLPIDIAYWTEDAEAILHGLAEIPGEWDLVITGQITSQGQAGAEAAGFKVITGFGQN